MQTNVIHLGDCLTLLSDVNLFPDASVDCVITSPPYFQQRDYHGLGIGNETDVGTYIDALLTLFQHCLRIVRPTGSIVINLGDKYDKGNLQLIPYRFALAVVDRYPVHLINDVTWVKSNPTPHQNPRKLVAATEPFFVFAKSKQYYFDRSGFIADDRPLSKTSSKIGSNYHVQIEQAATLSDVEKTEAHAALDAAIQDVKGGVIAGLRMKLRGVHALAYGGQDGGRNRQIVKQGYTIIRLHAAPMKRDVIRYEDVIEQNVETIKGNRHPAVYPVSLIEEFIRLLSPLGGSVLDPFCGSGSTAVAAINTGRCYIGIEIDPIYHAHSVDRLNHATSVQPKSVFFKSIDDDYVHNVWSV